VAVDTQFTHKSTSIISFGVIFQPATGLDDSPQVKLIFSNIFQELGCLLESLMGLVLFQQRNDNVTIIQRSQSRSSSLSSLFLWINR
jgi:hypothetical protein